jgi:hypothetical protein
LWGATMVHKAAVLLFSVFMSRVGGLEALGVMGSVLAVSWVGGTLAGRGLPDRALYLSADASDGVAARGHGRYLAGLVPVHLGLVAVAPWVGGVEALGPLARWMALGAALQGCTAFVFTWLRGQGAWRMEACGLLGSAACLGIGVAVGGGPVALGAWWAAGTGAMGLAALAAGVGPARPVRPRRGDPVDSTDLWFLAFGLGCWGIGNLDVLLVRMAAGAEDVGLLEAAKAWIRAGALVPWLVTSLTLSSDPGHRRSIGRGAVALGVVLAAVGWLGREWIAWAYRVELQEIQGALLASFLLAPVLYLALCRLLWAGQADIRATVRTLAGAGALMVGSGWFLVPQWGPAGAVLSCGAGQVWVLWSLRQPPPGLPGDPSHTAPR